MGRDQAASAPLSKARKPGNESLIEKQTAVGGVCINTGTIPSKTMREAVLHLSGFYGRNFYFNYPTLAECYKAAAFNGLNRLS